MPPLRQYAPKGTFLRYFAVVAATVVAFLGRQAMVRSFGHDLPPYVTFYPVIMVAALLGGVWPGLLSTTVAALLSAYWILPPQGFGIERRADAVGLALFCGMGAFMSLVGERYRRTRRKAAAYDKELALRESEARERHLLQQVMNGAKNAHLVYLDRDFNFVRVNEAYARTCGYTPEAMMGKNHFALYPDAENLAIFVRVRDTGEPAEFHDKPFVFPDQPERGVTYWDWTLTPVKDSGGQVAGLVFALVETTERKRAEVALQLQHELFETIVNHVPAPVLLAEGNDLRVLLVNPAYQAVAPGKEMVGKTLEEIWPEIGPEVPNIWRQVLATGEPYHVVDQLYIIRRSPEGPLEPRYFTWSVFRVPLSGKERWGLLNAAWETTENRQAEQALRQSEEQLRVAAMAAEIGIWTWVPGTGSVGVSANWRRLFGVAPNAQVTFDTWRNALHPEDRDRAVRELHAASDEHREFNCEYRVVWPDGTIRWIVDRGRASYDDNGRAVGMAGINLDITQRKQAEEALLRSEKLASVGRMAATIAHEINNPLSAVMNALYIARDEAASPELVRQALGLADEELRRIAQLARQALGFYRESTAPTRVLLNDVMDSALDLLKGKVEARRARVEKVYDAEAVVIGVAGELRQVFANLLANSLDAIDASGTITVRLSSRPADKTHHPAVTITVADNGKGIEGAALPHIFEPFFTTKQAVGTGLGLWVSKQIVEKHGGSIRVHSRTDGGRRGTTFSVVLPAAAGAEAVSKTAAAS